ncbi:MAG: peptidase T [Lachnospiraceae bacterium]|nr:peptidase T [Lachnospiraceae bacterium]
MTQTIQNFLRYVKIDTRSEEETGMSPSTAKQHKLAGLLYEELQALGAVDVVYDREHCYVYATIPAAKGYEESPVLGFISHMDTSPDVSGENVRPQIIENYDGKDIVLNETEQIIMRGLDFPELAKYVGQDLIVTDGTTLLGADDKAGVAEIMAMVQELLTHPELPHGTIKVGFTPDEEIGAGVDYFDVALFGADFAYTVDGGPLGELEYECFNAAGAKVIVTGRNVHPGTAKGKMKNAILIAQEFQSLLPALARPEHTEGYEGFYHLDNIRGNVEGVVADYIIRDFDRTLFEQKKAYFKQIADFLNQKYGADTVRIEMKDSYYNMREIIEQHMHLVDTARTVMEEMGIVPIVSPIRGGTDGARLSFMNLPCPNLCTGGENYHSRYEFACVQSMNQVTEMLLGIVQRYAQTGESV